MCQSHWLIFCSVNIFLHQSWLSGCSFCLQHSSISRLTNPKCFFLTETLSDFSVYWSFSFNINPSSEYSGLISFSIDWFDLLAVQGTLKSLLQHHGSKASILYHLAFFMVQLSYPYTTTGKTMSDYIDLCQQSHVSAF